MRAFALAIVALVASLPSSTASSSFHRDVVRRTNVRKNQVGQQRTVNDELLAKAIPVREFEEKHGIKLSSGGDRQLEQYQMNYNDMYSFSGYSLTFAKCQPVQYFSDEAVEMGSYSPMITDDIVVLRLCPTNSCSDSKEYGCYYNFAEYAIELSDYMNIMLRYAAQKKEYMCQYCNQCLGNDRRLDEEGDEKDEEGDQDENQDKADEDQEADQYDDEDENQDQEDEDQQQGDDAAQADYDNAAGDDDQGDDYYNNACGGWDSYCSDYSSQCVEDDGDNGGNNYLDYEGYLDYLECTEVNYNDARYYIKPRCDGYHNAIKMMVHYDAYCMQASSGNDMSIKNLGLGLRDSTFQEFYSGECVDCSESDYPPYEATSTMCNLIHYTSAKCVSDLEYNPFDNGYDDEVDDTTECSYIESIRTGTYDETGTITLRSFGFTSEKTTAAQKFFLFLFIALTVGLTVYACYLHHAMTNLLIKSLSHRELLPPSRHASRRSSPRRTGRRLKKIGNDSDWDDGNEYA